MVLQFQAYVGIGIGMEKDKMNNSKLITNWILETVKEQYENDIALVVSHSTLRIDDNEKVMSYFVPLNKRGEELADNFIIAGEGFDVWSMSWERLEQFANLSEYNITVLADGDVLYARTSEDEERFYALKKKQAENLNNKKKMRCCALEAYSQAKSIYLEMLFSRGSDVKLGAGYVLDYLAQAIAFSNLRYFKKAQTDQLVELQTMSKKPDGFEMKYQQVIIEPEEDIQKKLCYELIGIVQEFLCSDSVMMDDGVIECEEHNFQDLADDLDTVSTVSPVKL